MSIKQDEFRRGSSGTRVQDVSVTDIGKVSQSRNRIRLALATIYAEVSNSVIWTPEADIREFEALVTATDSAVGAPPSTENYVLVAINAPNETIAGQWLTEVDSANADAQTYKFLVGERFVRRTTSPILRLDFKPVNVSTTMSAFHLWVGGQ